MTLAIQTSYNPYSLSPLAIKPERSNYQVNFTGTGLKGSVSSAKLFIKNNRCYQKLNELIKWSKANKLKAAEYANYIYGGGALLVSGTLHLAGYHTGGNVALGGAAVSFLEGGGIRLLRAVFKGIRNKFFVKNK